MPFCPKCRYEYRPDIETCPDCAEKLVAELTEEAMPEWVELVEVASFLTAIQAEEVKIMLENSGIQAFIRNGITSQMHWGHVLADGGVKLCVRVPDVDDALKALSELNEQE